MSRVPFAGSERQRGPGRDPGPYDPNRITQRTPQGLAKFHPLPDPLKELINAAKQASLVLSEMDRRDGNDSETTHRLRMAIKTIERIENAND